MSASGNKFFREFSWPVRVYYEDTDSGGVVYYANYLKFLERARTEFLRNSGFEQDQLKQEQGIIFAVHSLSIQYINPATFNDELMVNTKIIAPGRASLTFKQSIERCTENRTSDSISDRTSKAELICDAEVKIVCLDAEKFSPVAIPENIMTSNILTEAGEGRSNGN
jgi:acyl-CoA thioester hydrolase